MLSVAVGEWVVIVGSVAVFITAVSAVMRMSGVWKSVAAPVEPVPLAPVDVPGAVLYHVLFTCTCDRYIYHVPGEPLVARCPVHRARAERAEPFEEGDDAYE